MLLAPALLLACLSALTVATAGAQNYRRPADPMARVLDSRPVTQQVQVGTVQQCAQGSGKAPNIAGVNLGTVLGAVAGGALGNQIGGGSGRTIATGAGAAVGAVAGTNINDNLSGGGQTCQSVPQYEQRILGYDVTYEYAGMTYTSRLRNPPGEFIPVRVSVQPVGN
jgi:uncharacterized protein YcfJ